MCFGGGKAQETETPARAPDAPLPAPDDPEIGQTRRDENVANFGQDDVPYRVTRVNRDGKPGVAPSGPIQM